MTKEQIEQAAWLLNDDQPISYIGKAEFKAFMKGAEFRQAEIDELNEQINSLKATLDIEVNHIQPRMKTEIDELAEALKIANNNITVWFTVEQKLLVNELLKKYEK